MYTFTDLQRGVIHDSVIGQFVETELIKNSNHQYVQPASIDVLPDLNEIFEIDYFYPPRKGEKVETILKELCLSKAARKIHGTTLTKGKRYLLRMVERIIGLPFYVRMNPKSSPGRTFLHSRLLTDGHTAYDEIYPEHQPGCHWMMFK